MKKYMLFTSVLIIMAIPLAFLFSKGYSEPSGDPIVYSNWSIQGAENECAQVGDFTDGVKIKDIKSNVSKSSNGNEITLKNVSIEEDAAKSFSWSSSNGIGAVIVLSGDVANVWFYNPQSDKDTGLYGYQNGSIDQITFCWSSSPTEEIVPTSDDTSSPTDEAEETATPTQEETSIITPTEDLEETATATPEPTETSLPDPTEEEPIVISETPEPIPTDEPTDSPTDEIETPTQTETPSDDSDSDDPDDDDIESTDEEPVEEASIQLEIEVSSINDDPKASQFNQVGDTIKYAFTVINTGNVTLTDVVISDPSATISGDPITSLEPGASDNSTFSATYTVTQADIDAGSFTNSASVIGTAPSGDVVIDKASYTTNWLKQEEASIELIKEVVSINDDPEETSFSQVGDKITYSFTVTNTGNVTLNNVNIFDPSAVVSGSLIASLAPGKSDSASFTATYNITQEDIDAGFFTNTATASGITPSGDIVKDEAFITVEGLEENASIELVLQVVSINGYSSATNFNQKGDEITYALTVTNTGDVDLTNVVISESLADVTGGPISILAPGASDSTTFKATHIITQGDLEAEYYANTATVTGETPSGNIIAYESTVVVNRETRRLH